ncbi:MAG: hypothetical protein ACD_79C00949G0001 [uncultured bacterium]|nr:MAG: hypothetical protein ACD_79C00949G0001 [uncultured bacterium]
MIFTYNKSNKEICLNEETNFKSNGLLERQDLEKWIEENPDILGEELLIITTEYNKFDKTDERLDLLAIDREGNLVIIELKKDDSGKNVELQAIKYAAYCSTLTFSQLIEEHRKYLLKKGMQNNPDIIRQKIKDFVSYEFEELNDKPRIILVSREYRPEVTASILWLRKFGININCVKLTPYNLDDKIIFESTIIIPLPEAEEYLIKAEQKENVEHTMTVSQEEYIKFYKELIKKLQTKLQISFADPLPKAYYQIPTGISGVHFEWGFHGRPRSNFGVELHFEKGNRDFNQKMLTSIEKLKDEIEKLTGEKVIFNPKWSGTYARLYLQKNEGSMTEELKIWAIEKMAILYNLLQPEIEKLN